LDTCSISVCAKNPLSTLYWSLLPLYPLFGVFFCLTLSWGLLLFDPRLESSTRFFCLSVGCRILAGNKFNDPAVNISEILTAFRCSSLVSSVVGVVQKTQRLQCCTLHLPLRKQKQTPSLTPVLYHRAKDTGSWPSLQGWIAKNE
jgi:hypothetical protein